MTDHYNGLFVVLSRDTREDDAEAIINAICCIKGVHTVTPRDVTPEDYIAQTLAKRELIEKLWKVLEE